MQLDDVGVLQPTVNLPLEAVRSAHVVGLIDTFAGIILAVLYAFDFENASERSISQKFVLDVLLRKGGPDSHSRGGAGSCAWYSKMLHMEKLEP